MNRARDWSSIDDIVRSSVEAGDEIGAGVSVWQHATASALAGFYAELLEPDGPVTQLLGPELLREYTSVQATGHDLVLDREVSWTFGFQRDEVEIGMGGIGGSSAWVSTAKGYSCAYVTRGLATHDRVDAVWEEIERLLPADILEA